ncbi:MAG: hypothetical protein U0670_08530 [Anaerolineae bacterium]
MSSGGLSGAQNEAAPVAIPFEEELAGLISAMLAMTAPPSADMLSRHVLCAASLALAATDQAVIDQDALMAAFPNSAPPAVIAGIQAMLDMRRQSSAFEAGSSHFLHTDEPIVRVERFALNGDERAMIIHNWSAARTAFTLPAGRWNHLDCACPVAPDEYPILEPFEVVWMVER